jgi:hypothetical protein
MRAVATDETKQSTPWARPLALARPKRASGRRRGSSPPIARRSSGRGSAPATRMQQRVGPRGLPTRAFQAMGVAERGASSTRAGGRARWDSIWRRLVGVEPPEGSPSRHAGRRRPVGCGRIAVCESSAIARTSSRSRRRGRSSPPWLPARGSRSTRCALLPTLRQPPSSCSGGSWRTSIGLASGSQSGRRTATGADSARARPAAEAGQAGAPAAIWSRTCVVTWSNSSTNWS